MYTCVHKRIQIHDHVRIYLHCRLPGKKKVEDLKEYPCICIHVYANIYKYMIIYEYIFIAGCLGKRIRKFKEYPEWIMKRQYENFGVEDFKFIWCVLARGTVCVCSNVVWQ